MFEVLVFVYEHYWRGDACPELHQLGRKLTAHGFDADEIQDALVWLDGLNLVAQSIRPGDPTPALSQPDAAQLQSLTSMRIYSVAEQDHLGAECLGFVYFLESAGVLPAGMREIVIDRVELDDARWFDREEVAAMLLRTHPDGLATPPTVSLK